MSSAAVGFTGAAALAFILVQPPVGDFWAAQARRYAALHGVGLHYWFAWFGGTVPGHYSVVAPYLLRVVDAGVLGAVSTVASVLLCRRLIASTSHAAAAAWCAAIGTTFSLWSGRIPFALGTALMLAGFVAVTEQRRGRAAIFGAITTLISPVSGAFLALGLCGAVLHHGERRAAAMAAAGAAGASLLGVALYFGLPGPQGFPATHALLAAATTALMLLARPPAFVRTVLQASIVACPFLVLIPNGMGTNFERFTWICLPVAVIATGQARRLLVFGASAIAVLMSVIGSSYDLYVAAQPMSTASYTDGLAQHLDSIANLDDFRVEVVPDGSHAAAYTLLSHASLARGYETQSDNGLNQVLMSDSISIASYRGWLNDNAVAYVALDRETLLHSPEDTLVRAGTLPYLHLAWSDANWLLYAVDSPVPIAHRPAKVVEADQAKIVISVPEPGTYELRVRWSRFLTLGKDAPIGTLRAGQNGRTLLVADEVGDYSITS